MVDEVTIARGERRDADQGAARFSRDPDHCGQLVRHEGEEEKARASGCDDYVTKLYSPVDLLCLVRRYLGKECIALSSDCGSGFRAKCK